MNIKAESIEDLIEKAGEQKDLLAAVDRLIASALPDQSRTLFSGQSITMIGYGQMPWMKSSSSGIWPLIGLAPQKGTVNVYVAAETDGIPLVEKYRSELGKVSTGKNCIRIARLSHINGPAFGKLLHEAQNWWRIRMMAYEANSSPGTGSD